MDSSQGESFNFSRVMDFDMEELREIARFLDREVQKFSQKAFSDVKTDAPRTTPGFSNFEVWFGRSRYKAVVRNVMMPEGEMTHVDFLEAIMSTYLKDETSFQVKGYEKKTDYDISKLSWDKFGTVKGEQSPGRDIIWMQFLPRNVAESLGRAIASNFDSRLGNALRSFPADYSKRNFPWSANAGLKDFESTFAHELTHLYATANTKLGEMQREGGGYYETPLEEVSSDEFAKRLSNMEHRKKMKNQASEISTNDNIIAIEEVYAHFIGFQYVERRDVDSSYDRDKYIQWGLDILYEKASAENPGRPVDWAREEMKQVFEDIARRGQVRKDGGLRDVFIIFLKRMMPQSDRKRMNYMRQIAEGDLSTAYSDLHQALQDIERMEKDRGREKAFNDFRSFEQEVDWDNPREIEDVVLHKVLEEAVGSLSLSETEKLLKKEISKEARNLEQLIEKAKSLEKELENSEQDQELVTALKELSQAEQEVAQLT